MKRLIVVTACLLLIAAAIAQVPQYGVQEQRPPLSERLFFGGSFGLMFGTVTNVEVAPMAGVWLLPRLAVAAGPSYQFYKDPRGKTSIYGGRAMIQFDIIQDLNNVIPLGWNSGIFVTGLYEALSLERSFSLVNPDNTGRFYYGTVLAGAGISQHAGPRARLNISFLWAVTGDREEMYSTPEIRVEFYF